MAECRFRTTPNQERYLALEEWNMRCGAVFPPFHSLLGLVLPGDVNLKALQCALDCLAERHSALRSQFIPVPEIKASERESALAAFAKTGIARPGLYRTIEADNMRVTLTVSNHGRPSEQAWQTLIRNEIRVLFESRFLRADAPLMRGHLLARDDSVNYLIIVFHHLVTDMWSLRVLQEDLTQLYAAACAEADAALPTVSQYHDFAEMQQQWLQTEMSRQALDYWMGRWMQMEPGLLRHANFPFGRIPSVKTRSFAVGVEGIPLSPEVTEALRTVARQLKSSIFMLGLAAFCIVLFRYTKKNQVGVWVNCANRMHAESQRIVGYCANAHRIGIELDQTQSFLDVIRLVRKRLFEALRFQELPLPYLWNMMQRRADMNGVHILFDQALPDAREEHGTTGIHPDCNLRDKLSALRMFTYLNVYLVPNRAGSRLCAVYACDHFNGESIVMMLRDLHDTIVNLVGTPAARISVQGACPG